MGHGLVDLVFEVHRGFVTEGAVEPLAVVKDFDPLEDGGASLRPRGELAAMHKFAFEAAPKAFHGGVVITVAPAAQARHGSSLRPPLPIVAACILDGPVR